ncbi:synaptopodin 2-like protein [Corythoichthys intestinalis]|uniref:synaptopodin 2-like protein n=1 Tax=Corythoichthys intestinalis TaxID=161448 RepID=UPI0025A5DF97|nr:synaptopodin 2-like protein [Corythoichthys intestinalis]XP_061808018.1 synaptopodin 2-like protein [Nerophis lumbriciformis]
MVAEEIVVSLSGGSPWGFRLQGGKEQQQPLQVAKVRRRSKACRAGLKEQDELVAIGEHSCTNLSHAQAMSLIDAQNSTLHLRVKRSPSYPARCSPPLLSVTSVDPNGVTSPPDSEAYYGETDSDADTRSHAHRRQRRTSPHARSPARYDNHGEEEETSEMSGYESANEAAGGPLQGQWHGVPHKDFIYQPPQLGWTTPVHSLTPHSVTPTPERAQGETEGEGDSGFQEAGACICPPLVSPERAKEALMLGSSSQLVPMVGPQQGPVSEELAATYMDKARQAKLQRGESLVEKQVKEARTKCRSIASLLTDAPNPNSKGVLMFKKRRQRAKKYTLTCFGKAEEDQGGESTEGETEEEGGSSIQSSEVDEEGFSASFDPTWDSGYLDLLDRRSAACPPTTPSATNNNSPGGEKLSFEAPVSQIPSLEVFGQETMKQLDAPKSSAPEVPLVNGCPVSISRASVTLSSPPLTPPLNNQNGPHVNVSPNPNFDNHSVPAALNRTARPFTPGPTTPCSSVTSVMFRPPQPKPAAAVSMVTIAPTHYPSVDGRRAVSSTSLYIPPRNNGVSPSVSSSALSPPSSLCPSIPVTPQPAPAHPAQSFSPPQPFHSPPSFHPTPSPGMSPISQVQVSVVPPNQDSTAAHPMIPAPMVTAPTPQTLAPDSLGSREQRISVPAARTGILHDARSRSSKKPMFSAIRSKDVSPNPALMSMVQNMDDRFTRTTAAESAVVSSCEAGHESGPEEDWLRLGAEACNFMQAQRGSRPPPVAPKPHTTQGPQLAGKGGQLFARRQNRMDRYVVERSPSAAPGLFSPSQTREPSPTPSLPATWKYSSNIRAPPPISYNPLLSPSCPPKAQKKAEVTKSGSAGTKGKKSTKNQVDVMKHQPYQLNSSLFTYGGSQDSSSGPQQGGSQKTARVYEVKRYSTPPPTATSPALKVIVPRSATTLGEPLWRSDIASPPPQTAYHPQTPPTAYQSQWSPGPLSPPIPPAPTAPLPQLPTFISPPNAVQSPMFSHLQPQQADRQFKSAPDLSPLRSTAPTPQASTGSQYSRVPRPRFSTSNLGLQPCVWRPGSTAN